MIRIMLMSIIPGLCLIVQNGINLIQSSEKLKVKLKIKDSVRFTLEVGRMIHRTQIERGTVALYITSNNDVTLENRLNESFRLTDEAVDALSQWKYTEQPVKFQTKQLFHNALRHFRSTTANISYEESVHFYTDDNAVLVDWMVSSMRDLTESQFWADMVAYHMLIFGKECTGVERALGTAYFASDGLQLDTLLWFKGRHDLGKTFLSQFKVYSDVGKGFHYKYVDPALQMTVDMMQDEILLNRSKNVGSLEAGTRWFDNMTSFINSLDDVMVAMADHITKKTEEDIVSYTLSLVLNIVILLLTLIIVPLLTFFIYKITKKLECMKNVLLDKTCNLETEQKRTETLLSLIVPAKVAKRMRTSTVEPQKYASVTVMVTDISNFDVMMLKNTPEDLIELVNSVFEMFQKRIVVYNASKIGAIGNVCMVVSGLQEKQSCRHVVDMANLALDLREKVQQISLPSGCSEYAHLVIGISTGSVVAGMVEGTIPRYCLYGKAVTDAHAMQETCLPQQIQVTETTYKELAKLSTYAMKERDAVGKNGTRVQKSYWLLGNPSESVAHFDLELTSVDI